MEIFFRSVALCNDLDQFKKIIIYGTGNFAQKIYPQLVEGGLKNKVLCFAQTEVADVKPIDEIPVECITSIKSSYDKSEVAVLIAVSKRYTDEIKRILFELAYINVIVLTDYQLNYKHLEAKYSQLTTFREYCEYIADWYVRKKGIVSDRTVVVQKLLKDRETVQGNPRDLKLIVIVSGNLSPRTIKIVRALRRKNYNIIMLRYLQGGVSWCFNELKGVGIQTHHCSCVAELLYFALQYNPLVYFFEPLWGDCLWAEIMIKNKEYFGKIVFAPYDVLNDGYVGIEEDKLLTEKYALEHADGIVWRWFSKEYLEEMGFKFCGKSIQFLDYCEHVYMGNSLDDRESSVLKLCMIGGYADEFVEDRTYSSTYIDWARIGEILEKIGNRQDCIFHFYAGHLNDRNIIRCKMYENEYRNFKFFLSTSHEELVKRLRDYDYGCDIHTDGEYADRDVSIGGYSSSNFVNSVSNKHFDFLTAGLPVVTSQQVKFCEYLSAYGVVINMSLSNIDIDYLKQHRDYYKKNVDRARIDLDIDNQISRLIEFFKEV